MDALNQFLRQNKRIFTLLVCCWLAGAICALFCATKTSGASFDVVKTYICNTFEKKTSFFTIFKNGISANIGLTLFLLFASCHVTLIPLTALSAVFKGFSTSLATSFLIRIYTWKGTLASFISVVIPLSFSLTVTFAMYTCAIRHPIKKRENTKRAVTTSGKERISHFFTMTMLCGCLCLISAIEALISVLMFYIL